MAGERKHNKPCSTNSCQLGVTALRPAALSFWAAKYCLQFVLQSPRGGGGGGKTILFNSSSSLHKVWFWMQLQKTGSRSQRFGLSGFCCHEVKQLDGETGIQLPVMQLESFGVSLVGHRGCELCQSLDSSLWLVATQAYMGGLLA